MKEAKITKCIKNERNELVVSFIVKEEDYGVQDEMLLKQAKNTGDMLDLEFTGLLKENPEKERNTKLQTLGAMMDLYCEKGQYSRDSERSAVCARNKVGSRKELSDSALDREIESYKAGLQQFN